MGKKPSLFSQAASEAQDVAVTTPDARQPFAARISAIEETAERVPSRLRRVEPEACRMWEYHNRAYDSLTEDNCRDLIDSIIAQGKQEQPAIVRELPGEGTTRYEVIAGARRHFAISWLRANNYPQMKYFIEVRDLADEECFRLSDLENRNRKDISDYERALDYQSALERYYSTQLEMAKRLNVAENWLSRYLLLANVPQEVVSAYASINDLRLRHARELSPFLKAAASRRRVFSVAADLASQHQADRAAKASPMTGPEVFKALLNAAKTTTKAKPQRQAVAEYPASDGNRMLVVSGKTKQKLTVVIDRDSGASTTEMMAAFKQALAEHF